MAYRPYETDEMSDDAQATELASPWARLAAILIDALFYLIVLAVAAIVVFGVIFFVLEIAGLETIGLLLVLALLIISFILQMTLLATRGQTIGKIAMKVRIVDSVTGMHPGWARLVLLRTIVNGILTGIPFIGGIYWLVDSLFIFRADHRTIHDMIADTRVDKVAD